MNVETDKSWKDLLKAYIKKNIPHKVFWVMENTSNGYQTHNHLLLEGNTVQYELDKYLKEKNLVDERFVKHVAYNASLGASHYVSKFISSDNADYDISFKKTNYPLIVILSLVYFH